VLIERLTTRHDRESFDCGEESLNQYLRQLARQKGDRDLGVTFVLMPERRSAKVLAYYTLVAGTVTGEVVPERSVTKQRTVPVVRLARLAVDRRRQGERLGESLLFHALHRVQVVAEMIGAYAVVVDALNERAQRFYLRYGFRPLLDDPCHLYLTLSSIRALNLGPEAG
jgi:GNAT superfamily N-acetyltransferase